MSELELYSWAERMRELPNVARHTGVQAVAMTLKDFQRSHAEKGLAPDGTPWARTQQGRAPLQGVAAATRVVANTRGAQVVVRGHHALHHHGWVSGGTARPVIPDQLTPEMAERISGLVSDELERSL